MKLATSGSRGVFWRSNDRGTQQRRLGAGRSQHGDWWVRWACPHGHLHRAQIGPKSLAQREAERRRLERPCPERTPKQVEYLLSDAIDEYLAQIRNSKRSYRDDARYGASWKHRFPGRLLEEVSPSDLERVKAERLESVKPSTVNRELAFLKHLYNVVIRDGKTERNPVTKIRLLKEPSGRARYLTDNEEQRLMEALVSESERERLRFLIHTGLRKSEFTNLRWKDVDLKAGIITIPRSKNGETRHVPMTSSVKMILSRMPRPIESSTLVFPSCEGTPHSHWAERTFPEAVRRAEIADFRFHDLRHTFASRLAMERVDLLTIKELGGWKSLTMVQRYAHLSPSHRNQAIERLATRKPEWEPIITSSGVAP